MLRDLLYLWDGKLSGIIMMPDFCIGIDNPIKRESLNMRGWFDKLILKFTLKSKWPIIANHFWRGIESGDLVYHLVLRHYLQCLYFDYNQAVIDKGTYGSNGEFTSGSIVIETWECGYYRSLQGITDYLMTCFRVIKYPYGK